MTDYHNVAMIKGDLNGKTVSDAVLKVDEAARPVMSKPIKWTQMPYDVDYFLKHDIKALRKEELDELRRYDQIFLGAVGDDTRIKRGTMELGILLKVRQEFNQRVNLRPIVLPEGVESPIKGKDHSPNSSLNTSSISPRVTSSFTASIQYG